MMAGSPTDATTAHATSRTARISGVTEPSEPPLTPFFYHELGGDRAREELARTEEGALRHWHWHCACGESPQNTQTMA